MRLTVQRFHSFVSTFSFSAGRQYHFLRPQLLAFIITRLFSSFLSKFNRGEPTSTPCPCPNPDDIIVIRGWPHTRLGLALASPQGLAMPCTLSVAFTGQLHDSSTLSSCPSHDRLDLISGVRIRRLNPAFQVSSPRTYTCKNTIPFLICGPVSRNYSW